MPTPPARQSRRAAIAAWEALSRERLLHLLDGALVAAPGLWLSGPPGAGKSHLLTAWARLRERESVVLRLEHGDTDPRALLHRLADAIAPAGSPARPAAPRSGRGTDTATALRSAFAALKKHLPERAVIVLEDAHQAPDATLVAWLQACLAEVPEGSVVCVSSRRRLPSDLAALAAARLLLAPEPAVLQFNPEETLALARSLGCDDRLDVEALHQHCEGWATGIMLFLEHARQTGLGRGQLALPTALSCYFEQLVSTALPGPALVTALALAEAGQLGTAEAVAVTGDPGAPSVLDFLSSNQLLVTAHATEPGAVRMHPLLRRYLRREGGGAAPSGSMLRTARVLVRNGRYTDAVPLLLEAGAWDEVTEAIGQAGPAVLAKGEAATLRLWMREVPEVERNRRPVLRLWEGWSLAAGSPERALVILEEAYTSLRAVGDHEPALLAASAILDTLSLDMDRYPRADPWLDAAEDLMTAPIPLPRNRTLTLLVLGAVVNLAALRRPGSRMLELALPQLRDAIVDEPEPSARLRAAALLLGALIHLGNVNEARQLVDLVEDGHPRVGIPDPVRALWWMRCGLMNLLCGRHREADVFLRQAGAIGGSRPPPAAHIARCFLVSNHACAGRLAEAEACLPDMEHARVRSRALDQAQYHLAWCSMALGRMDAPTAAVHGQALLEAGEGLGAPYAQISMGAPAVVCLALGQKTELALAGLQRYRQLLETHGLDWLEPMLLAAESYVWLQRGERARGHECLSRAMAQGRAEGTIGYLRWLMGVTQRLLAECLHAGIHPDYACTLIRAYGIPPPAEEVPGWPYRVRVYTLGRFLVEVDGAPLRFERKTPRKPIQLLKAIVARGGSAVSLARLMDDLWEGEEGDAAAQALKVALHRLRRLLGTPDALRVEDSSVTLDPRLVWVDALAFDTAWADGLRPMEARLVYRGEFLAEDRAESWSAQARERLRDRFHRWTETEVDHWVALERPDRALQVARAAIDASDTSEPLYQILIRLLVASGRLSEASASYRRLCEVLRATGGGEPTRDTRRLLEHPHASALTLAI